MAAHYVRLAVALASIDALVYTPPRNISMYDAWLYVDDGAFTAYYLAKPANASGSGAKPAWDRVMTITSDDGATWSDAGVAVAKAPGAKWLGSGSVWRTGDAFVLSYSQEGYGCAGDPGGGPTGDPTWCQSLFFATAPTPRGPWTTTPAGAFPYGEGYEIGGRWDCVAALRDGDGGFYGYWTASPRDGGCDSCGAGFGYSKDGVTWAARPTPGPEIKGEVGGVARAGGRVVMLFDAGRAFWSDAPAGPFAAAALNPSFLGQALGARFPRIWGSDVTGGPLLATHHQMTGPDCSGDGGLECPVYLGLVKRATLGADGGLRATWFEGNDNLRGEELARVADADLDRGLWLEGTLGAGGGFAVGLAGGGGDAAVVVLANGSFALGLTRNGAWTAPPHVVDRSLAPPSNATWRALVRNSATGFGMLEAYVGGVLALPWTLPGPAAPRAAPVGAATLDRAYELRTY